jgi:hypothetical protein
LSDMADSAREAFLTAFASLGGARALDIWARNEPTLFYNAFLKQLSPEAADGGPPADVSEAPLTEAEWLSLVRDAG